MERRGHAPSSIAHVHLWDLTRIRYPWLTPPFSDDGPNGSVEAIARDLSARRLSAPMRPGGTSRASSMSMPARIRRRRSTRPSGCRRWPTRAACRTAIVAFAALDDPQVEALLAAHARAPQRARHPPHRQLAPRSAPHLHRARRDRRTRPGRAGFALLGKYGLSFDLQAYPGQFAGARAADRAASRDAGDRQPSRHAGARAMPTGWRRGAPACAALAALPHVAVKISGMGFVDPAVDARCGARPLILRGDRPVRHRPRHVRQQLSRPTSCSAPSTARSAPMPR